MRFWIFLKWPHGYFDFFKDAVIGYRLFWISMKLSHEVTSWVFWMFKSWRHGYCEYSWSELRVFWIFEVTSLVFWITKWRYGNIQKLTSWVFWNSYSKLHDFFWIFKIPMTSLQKYSKYQCHYECSKYPCHIFKITLLLNIQNTHDITSRIFQNTHDVRFWIFPWRHFMNNQNASWVIWIFENWRHGYFENSWSDVIGLLNTHEVTSWLFMKWPHG